MTHRKSVTPELGIRQAIPSAWGLQEALPLQPHGPKQLVRFLLGQSWGLGLPKPGQGLRVLGFWRTELGFKNKIGIGAFQAET